MKKLILMTTAFWLTSTATFAQMDKWILNPKEVEFGAGGTAGDGSLFGNKDGIAVSHIVTGTEADRDIYVVTFDAVRKFRLNSLGVTLQEIFPIPGGGGFIAEADLFLNCNGGVSNGFHIEDWSDGSDDTPYSMELAGDLMVVSAMLNRLIMWPGTNNALGGDTAPGLDCQEEDTGLPCTNYHSDAYLWGEAYLLFVRKSDLGLQKATHLGTMSGGDFQPRMVKTSDGGFAVVGTVTGCPDGLPPVGESEHILVVKVDANGDIEWRKQFNGPSEGACGFGIAEAPGGTLVVVGNTEDEDSGEGDNYLFASVGSSCDYSTAGVLPNSGNDYVVQPGEVWSTDKQVRARVVVPAGVTLNIEGQQSAPITVQFADSREVFDFNNRYPVGVSIEKGGRLIVRHATLTGWGCSAEKMWDGIAVSGDASLPQTTANQGYCDLLSGAVLQNAHLGVTACPQWISQLQPLVNSYAGTGTQSSVLTSTLDYGRTGGARIRGTLATLRNNYRDVIFMKYDHNLDQSRFWFANFLSDGPLADPTEIRNLEPASYDYTEPRGTFIHASAWHTRVEFRNCTFTGSSGIVSELRPIGIISYEGKIIQSSGSMTGLKVGTEMNGPLGSLLTNLDASNVTFDNCVLGINLRNSVAADGNVLWDASGLPAGVYFYRIRSSLGEEVANCKVVKVIRACWGFGFRRKNASFLMILR